MSGRVQVHALGNADRGDAGLGPAVPALLRGRLPAGAELRVCGGDALGLIEGWAGLVALVCVDASAPAGEPGRICSLETAMDELVAEPASCHGFGLAEALAPARVLGLAPPRLVVYAVEGRSFRIGAPLSAEVAAAAEAVAGRILGEVGRLLRPAEAGEEEPCAGEPGPIPEASVRRDA